MKRNTLIAAIGGSAVVIGLLVYTMSSIFNSENKVASHQREIGSPKSRAILIHTDGTKTEIDQLTKRKLKDGKGRIFASVEDGKLHFNPDSGGPIEALPVETIITPKGGLFDVYLPDGTLIKLNVGSTLKYPTRFDGTERKVEIDGEAFFDVVPDSTRPFVVATAKEEIREVGDGGQFNIKS